MKKNKMMRAASGLLVAVLLTTCVISGTFAKYVSKGTALDSARVAKWGVTITATSNMFSETYKTDDANYTSTYTNSVISNAKMGTTALGGGTNDRVLAPGTSGTLTDVTINGIPEVAFKVTYEPKLTITGWKYTVTEDENPVEKEYFPVVFTVEGTDYYVGKEATTEGAGDAINDISDLIEAVEGAIEDCSKSYAANVAVTATDAPSVSWRWEFNKNTLSYQTDELDTLLGDQAANDITKASTISLEIVTTATQID